MHRLCPSYPRMCLPYRLCAGVRRAWSPRLEEALPLVRAVAEVIVWTVGRGLPRLMHALQACHRFQSTRQRDPSLLISLDRFLRLARRRQRPSTLPKLDLAAGLLGLSSMPSMASGDNSLPDRKRRAPTCSTRPIIPSNLFRTRRISPSQLGGVSYLTASKVPALLLVV
jgi:hypothetical protein